MPVKELPTTADDPRLQGWYHTIDLGNGLCSRGEYDLRKTVDLHLPPTLEGKTALDVGTCNGFWAFEMEKRGARVTAMDVERWSDFDWLPWLKDSNGHGATGARFELAHAMRGSSVERRICSVYDLSPEFGTFDFVFCGSLLMHLQNPLLALTNICSVTREQAVIATLHSADLEAAAPDEPTLAFGFRQQDLYNAKAMLGASCVYWHFNTKGLREMMEYAGFARTEHLGYAPLYPLTESVCTIVAGHPDPEETAMRQMDAEWELGLGGGVDPGHARP